MKLSLKKALQELEMIYGKQEIDVSMKEPAIRMEFYRYDLSLCITAALILCIIFFIEKCRELLVQIFIFVDNYFCFSGSFLFVFV